MYVRNLSGIEYPLQASTTQDSEINGNRTLSLSVLPTKVNNVFIADIAEMWAVIDDDDVAHKVVYAKRQGVGNTLTVVIKAVPLFYDDFDNLRIYEEYNQHMTAQAAFTLIFADTDYNFVLHDSHDAVDWEGFGAGESRLETFKRALNRYGAEFEIYGNTIHLKALIGRDTQFQYRHRLNASNITQEIDASGFWTYAKGYGDFGDGEGGGDWQDAKLIREYTSPLAQIPSIGIRHAPPIKDGRVKVVSAMDKALKAHVDESLKVSVTTDIHDLRKQGYALAQPQLGDRVFLTDERIGFDEEVRVVAMSITKDWRGNVTHFSITIGDEGVTKRHMSNMNTAIDNITNIVNGTQKIPYSVLDNAVLQATKALQNAQTELTFNTNGILAIDKLDPNNVTILNSAGVGVSTNGGASFGQAITGRGINASYIVTGVLDAGQVVVRGGSATKYTLIDGPDITSRGQYTRTWRGVTELHDITLRLTNGYFRAENPSKNRAISISDFGISTFADGDGGGTSSGTLEFFSRRFSDVNGLTAYSSGTFGIDAGEIVSQSQYSQTIESNESQIYFRPNRTNRPGNNTFALSILNGTQDYLADGFLSYGSTATGYTSGLRFSKRGAEPTVWVVNGEQARYSTTKIGAGYFMGYMAMSHTGAHFHLGSSSEIRSVSATAYQNGETVYIDHRAANLNVSSSVTYKTSFREPEVEGLYVINKLDIRSYLLNKEVGEGNYSNRQLGVVSELSPEIATPDGKAISLYKGLSYTMLAAQELSIKQVTQDSHIQAIYDVLGALIMDVDKLKGVS